MAAPEGAGKLTRADHVAAPGGWQRWVTPVWCRQSPIAFAAFGQDVIDGCSPHETTRSAVSAFDISCDRVDEFGDAVHGEALQLALTQVAEEALDQVEPR